MVVELPPTLRLVRVNAGGHPRARDGEQLLVLVPRVLDRAQVLRLCHRGVEIVEEVHRVPQRVAHPVGNVGRPPETDQRVH